MKFKCKILEFIINIIDKFRKYLNKRLYLLRNSYENNEKKEKYEKLSPMEIDDDLYLNELDQGLIDKDMKNIALSGPYGVGKSSILKTYIKKRPIYNYINISLANFEMSIDKNLNNIIEKEPKGSIGNYDQNSDTEIENKSSITNQLEASILKQMFYKVHHKKIPYSRYKRIKNLNTHNIIFNIIKIIVLLLLGTFLYNPQILKNIINIKINDYKDTNSMILIAMIGIFTWIGIDIIIKGIKYIKSTLKFNNIKTKNIDISHIDNKESIFNKNIEEILYFFEVTEYDVIIFEDLDRFNNIEIFTKLRELNGLVNNSEQIKRKITFIYSIRDDIFNDYKDRTKFFDFIIPIVPIVNSSNSEKYIKDRLNHLKISEELIENISMYIDDMRTLKNICNEFKIYKSIVNYQDIDKLFSIIVYKNIYPRDFSQLQFNKGLLSNVLRFENRESFLRDIKHSNYIKLNEINLNHELKIKKLQEEYLGQILEMDIKKLYIDGEQYDIDNIGDIFKENFDLKTELEYVYEQFNGLESLDYRNVISKEELLKVGKGNDYYNRKQVIDNWKNKRLESVRSKSIADEQIIINGNIQELIERFGIDSIVIDDNIKKEKILIYLIEKGYIDESYNSYIVQNKNGNLSLSDSEFIKFVRTNEYISFNYDIENPEYIINRIKESDCKKTSILNYKLFKFLVENKEKYSKYYELILDSIIDGISSEHYEINTNKYKKFLDEFIIKIEERKIILKDMALKFNEIWEYIYTNENIQENLKGECFICLLNILTLDEIVALNIENSLVSYIESENYIQFAEAIIEKHRFSKTKFRTLKNKLSINRSKLMLNKANILNKSSEYNSAIKVYGWAIEADETNIEAYEKRGDIYKFKGDYVKAKDDYMKVIEIDEKNINAYKNIAAIYLKEKEYAKAKEFLIRAYKLDPKNNDIKMELERLSEKNIEVGEVAVTE